MNDERFIRMAFKQKECSHDPNTKIGAVLVNDFDSVVSVGHNDFPFGIDNTIELRWERPTKYQYVLHAEHRAILNAARMGGLTNFCRLYLVGMGPPTVPCSECSKAIIQAGISDVIGYGYKEIPDYWKDDLESAQKLLTEAGVRFREFNGTI